jgi:hypothetical protein
MELSDDKILKYLLVFVFARVCMYKNTVILSENLIISSCSLSSSSTQMYHISSMWAAGMLRRTLEGECSVNSAELGKLYQQLQKP